jgi:ubiquinone/menaquinone biosynthesis C-methylase UbiE
MSTRLAGVSLYGRFFAATYDRMMAGTEEAGLARMRAELIPRAEGRVIEIGAGTGRNLDHYTGAARQLVLTEPEEPMAARLRARAAATDLPVEVTSAPAESLPFEDASFDTAVTTLALCTVDDPDQALAELRRVLRPGGQLLFLEHVRSRNPRLARWQDRFAPVWRMVGHGCNCNRPTADSIRRAGFELEQLEHDRVPKAPPIVRPAIRGRAVAP